MNRLLSISVILLSVQIGCAPKLFEIPYHEVKIEIDGSKADSIWHELNTYSHFISNWDELPVPTTEFKCFYDSIYLYFHYRVQDEQVICYDHRKNDLAVGSSDRVEIFFASNSQLEPYYGLEFDACNRVLQFKGNGSWNFEKKWKFPGLTKKDYKVRAFKGGYQFEARLKIKSLHEMNLIHDKKMLIGLHRADFSKNNEDKVRWISWKKIETPKPNFHNLEGFQLVKFQ